MENKLTFPEEAPADTKITVGIAALVIHENKILLEQRADCGLWACPGGRMEPGENISLTATREVKEETNIDIEIKRIFAIYSDPKYGMVRRYTSDSFSQQCVDIYLLAAPLSFEIKKSDESLRVEYFALDNTPSNIAPFAREVIKDYKRNPSAKFTILK